MEVGLLARERSHVRQLRRAQLIVVGISKCLLRDLTIHLCTLLNGKGCVSVQFPFLRELYRSRAVFCQCLPFVLFCSSESITFPCNMFLHVIVEGF